MNRRYSIYGLCCLIAMVYLAVSCQQHTYDFTHTPTSPKAGQTVSFVNQSDAGESWVWKFGDGGQSLLKNPTHIYTQPGSYVVELMADSNNHRKISHVLEVLDSVPTIYVASDTVKQYAPVTLKVDLYNPSGTTVSYSWQLDNTLFVLTEGTLTSDSLTGYFTNYNQSTEVKVTVTMGDKTTTDSRTLYLIDQDAPTLLMQKADGSLWRQRLYEEIYETAKSYTGDPTLIMLANDSVALLNGVLYNIHDMPVLTDLTISALQVDVVNRKLYLILSDGLYVANANGDALTRILDTKAYTLLMDGERNRLYWSADDGVWVMPLVTNPQNIISQQLLGKMRRVNEVEKVQRMLIAE